MCFAVNGSENGATCLKAARRVWFTSGCSVFGGLCEMSWEYEERTCFSVQTALCLEFTSYLCFRPFHLEEKISRCSKLFYIILSKYFYFASRSQASPQHSSCKQACLALHSVCTDIASRYCAVAACSALRSIAGYVTECRTSRCGART